MNKRAKPDRVKKSGIRAIDRGTVYDVPGRLIRLARQIEKGEHGEVTDVIITYRAKKGGINRVDHSIHGKSDTETLHFMACRAVEYILR